MKKELYLLLIATRKEIKTIPNLPKGKIISAYIADTSKATKNQREILGGSMIEQLIKAYENNPSTNHQLPKIKGRRGQIEALKLR